MNRFTYTMENMTYNLYNYLKSHLSNILIKIITFKILEKIILNLNSSRINNFWTLLNLKIQVRAIYSYEVYGKTKFIIIPYTNYIHLFLWKLFSGYYLKK